MIEDGVIAWKRFPYCWTLCEWNLSVTGGLVHTKRGGVVVPLLLATSYCTSSRYVMVVMWHHCNEYSKILMLTVLLMLLWLIGIKVCHISWLIWLGFLCFQSGLCTYCTLFPGCICNKIQYMVLYEITYPFQNLNGVTIEVWEWIRNLTPHFTCRAIVYSCWN